MKVLTFGRCVESGPTRAFGNVSLSNETLDRIRRIIDSKFTGFRTVAGYIQARLEPAIAADEQHLLKMAELRRDEAARGTLEKPWPRGRKKPD
jgi:uncharacterized membrane-anchored protein